MSKNFKELDIWKQVKTNIRFYFSEPNNAQPPTPGLWRNLSTHEYEVWSHFKKEGKVTFERAGFCRDTTKHYDVNDWLLLLLETSVVQKHTEEILEWLRTGKTKKATTSKDSG